MENCRGFVSIWSLKKTKVFFYTHTTTHTKKNRDLRVLVHVTTRNQILVKTMNVHVASYGELESTTICRLGHKRSREEEQLAASID